MKKLKKSLVNPRPFLAGQIIWSLLIAALAGACVIGQRGDLTPRAPEGPAMDLARGLYQRGESLKTLAVRGGVSHETGGRRNFYRFEALVLKPDRLLFTAFDPVGRPAFRLAVSDGRLTGLIYGSRQYLTGPATAENFARLLSLPLSQDQLVAILSGATARPVAAGARITSGNTELILVPAEAPEDENEIWRLKLSGDLDQNPRRAVLTAAARGPAGRPNLSLRYLAVQNLPREDENGALEPFPTSLEAEWAQEGEKRILRLTYDEVHLGAEINPSVFGLKQPEDFVAAPLP